MLLLRPDATRLEVVEELVHHGQAVRAKFHFPTDSKSLAILSYEREIEAQDILLKIAKKQKWTEEEVNRIVRNRVVWEDALRKAQNR